MQQCGMHEISLPVHEQTRLAKARNLPEDHVRQFVVDNTEGRLFGLLGEPRVNVLQLSLALDHLAAG